MEQSVSIVELKEEYVEAKGWRDFTLQNALAHSDKIISYDHGYYTLRENYASISMEQLKPIYEKIQIELADESVVYIRTFYENNDMYLKSIGIDSDHVLYVLLKDANFSRVYFPRFPYIVSENFNVQSLVAQNLVDRKSVV